MGPTCGVTHCGKLIHQEAAMLRGSNSEQKELTRQCLFEALMILWE